MTPEELVQHYIDSGTRLAWPQQSTGGRTALPIEIVGVVHRDGRVPQVAFRYEGLGPEEHRVTIGAFAGGARVL